MDAICDVYETSWNGAEALHAQVSAIEGLWQEFSHKLGDQVLIPLNGYTAQFPEMKVSVASSDCRLVRIYKVVIHSLRILFFFQFQKKIEKRNRKLIDYDGHR